MIVDHQLKQVFFTPPHTMSRSLHIAYAKAGHMLIYGANPDGLHDQHYMCQGGEFEEYESILIVRNPLERAVGLWFHLCEWNTRNGWGSWSFADFIHIGCKEESMCWMYKWSIAKLCSFHKVQPNKIIDVKCLPQFCEERGLALPEQPATFRKADWRSYYTPGLMHAAIKQYEGDEGYVVY